MIPKCHDFGFTLVELLITLTILGTIATFTIPKVIVVQQNGQYNAISKEVVAMISGAYQQAQSVGDVTTNTTPGDLTPYMNYIALSTTNTIDNNIQAGGTLTCSVGHPCLKLHNGGILWLDNVASFGGSNTTNMISFRFDPDGTPNGNMAVEFSLYYSGFITSTANRKPNSYSSFGGPYGPGAYDPPWFSW